MQKEVICIFIEYLLQFFFALLGHGRLQRIRKAQGGVEDAPPVMAFCLSDIHTKGIIDSFRESTGSIGFFRLPFFLKS